MTNEMRIQICRDDFYLMMRNAVLQAGGRDEVERWKNMRLEEVVNQLAQNGIRMVYRADKHMDSLHIEWKSKEQPPVGARKLLLDDLQRTDEEGPSNMVNR